MNKQFFENNELNDWELLEKFNIATDAFNHIKQSEVKHHTDGTGFTTNGLGETRYFNIELKFRNLNLLDNGKISGATEKGEFIDDTIFIESHKAADMLFDAINGLEPLYINFLSDGHVIIFNLNKLTKRPKKTGTMNIKSKGYGKFEVAKRQGLYLKDAAIYDKDYKLIKRSGQDFI
jgi:hypothetical protein